MCAAKDENAPTTNVEICTRNPLHEIEFKWSIDNATKFARRIKSHEFPDESNCKPRFRIVAKFHEKYPGIYNVNIGLQRVDDGKETIHMSVEVSLVNNNGLLYRTKTLSYTAGGDESPCYILSELFTSIPSKLKFLTSFSSDDNFEITEAQKKGLCGFYQNESEIFVLPSDVLVIKASIKSHGCCVLTETLPPKEILDDVTKTKHISQLLEDMQSSYQDSQFTDAELIVDDETIHTHRFILSLRSPVFRRMFEHDTQEKSSGKVFITDVNRQALLNFVSYLYTGVVKEESWDLMCALYAIAEKYEVFSLIKACSSIIASLIDLQSVCGILELSDLYGNDNLKQSAMEYLTLHFSKLKYNSAWEAIISKNQKLAAEVLIQVNSRSRGNVR